MLCWRGNFDRDIFLNHLNHDVASLVKCNKSFFVLFYQHYTLTLFDGFDRSLLNICVISALPGLDIFWICVIEFAT